MFSFRIGVGIEIEGLNISDNFDIIEQNQVEYKESIDIKGDSIDQVIVTATDLATSLSSDQGSSIDQNNDNISLSIIDEDTSIIYEDIDEYISEDTDINNKVEKIKIIKPMI